MMLNRFASIRPIGEDSRSASIANRTARGAYMERPRILGDTHGQATDAVEAFEFVLTDAKCNLV